MNWSISLWKVVFVFCLPSFRINLIGLKMVFFGFVSASASASVEREFKSITHGFFSHTVKVSISDVSPKLDMHVYCFIRWTFPIFFFASHRKTCGGGKTNKTSTMQMKQKCCIEFRVKKKGRLLCESKPLSVKIFTHPKTFRTYFDFRFLLDSSKESNVIYFFINCKLWMCE